MSDIIPTNEEHTNRLNRTMDAVITISTRNSYGNYVTHFLKWLSQQADERLPDGTELPFRSLINPDFSVDLNDSKRVRELLKLHDATRPPIHFDRLKIQVYMRFIFSLRLKNKPDQAPGFQTYNLHKSALIRLFKDFGLNIKTTNPVLSAALETAFLGLRNTTARVTQASSNVKTGKDPLSFSMYLFLGAESLKIDSKEYIFFHAFLTLSWNLMCRAQSAVSIRLGHIEWREDALAIYFAHSKADQGAERPRDPRHVYANPLKPEVCSILALALYFLFFPISSTEPSSQLFPGNSQYDRYRKLLRRLLAKESIATELSLRGISAESLGSHSTRKGSATFASSGSTCAPSHASICLRAGWTMRVVQDTYLRYCSAGDQYVGRTVSGLPIGSSEFALLPPMFTNITPLVRSAMQLAFPALPTTLAGAAPYFLASIVYHRQWLLQTMPATHPIHQTRLFARPDLLDQLAGHVVCRRYLSGDVIRPTGIPPHVDLLCNISELGSNIDTMNGTLSGLPDSVISGLRGLLEENALAARSVTPTELRATLEREIASIREMLIVRLETPSTASTSSTSDGVPILRSWGGRFHFIPEDYEIPTSCILDAWILWTTGNSAQGIPPLRKMNTIEFSSISKKKKFGHFKWWNSLIEQRLEAASIHVDYEHLDSSAALTIFQESNIINAIPETTSSGRKRRKEQLSWQSAIKILRKEVRQRRE